MTQIHCPNVIRKVKSQRKYTPLCLICIVNREIKIFNVKLSALIVFSDHDLNVQSGYKQSIIYTGSE